MKFVLSDATGLEARFEAELARVVPGWRDGRSPDGNRAVGAEAGSAAPPDRLKTENGGPGGPPLQKI